MRRHSIAITCYYVRLDYARRIDIPRADYALVERREFNDVTFLCIGKCIEKLFARDFSAACDERSPNV